VSRLVPVLLLAACALDPAAAPPTADDGSEARFPWGWVLGSSSDALPEVPLHDRPIHLMEEGEGTFDFVLPTLPGLRSTADARLGINPRRRGPNAEMYLLSPESLEGPLSEAEPGVHGWLQRIIIPYTDLFEPTGGDDEPYHYTLCDPTPEVPGPDDLTNPHPCPDDASRDCYDLTVVHSLGIADKETQLWSTPLHVEIADPKTPSAQAVVVETGEPVAGSVFTVLNLKELNTSGDGRLLVMRDDWSRNPYPTPEDPTQTKSVSINMVYAYADDTETYEPCDVRQWTELRPLSHFPHDPDVAHYPLAHFPFLDTEFQPIPDYGAMGLSYPWIDRKVSMLFFMGSRATLFYDSDTSDITDDTIATRYPARCLPDQTCGLPTNDIPDDPEGITTYEEKNLTRGVGMLGLWTRGKMVMLDGILNNTDYGIPRRVDFQREVQLYEAGTGPDPAAADGWVRVGTGFDNGLSGTNPPLGTSHNTAIIESTANLHFQHESFRTQTWRDVVWMVSAAKVSQEVAFDDQLDRDALIVSEMTVSATHTGKFSRNALFMHDGFDLSPPTGFPGFGRPVHFQNAASPELHRWAPPPFGLGYGGMRAEPVALGGIFGRGAWLSGAGDGIAYRFAEQPVVDGDASASAAVDHYTSVFFEPRMDDDGVLRDLLSFPDGSAVVLSGLSGLVVLDADGVEQGTVDLPWVWSGWHHLGLQRTDNGLGLTVLLDGFPYATLTFDEPLLSLGVGRVHLGDVPFDEREGVRGWVDEVKMFGRVMSPELACNQARGTLVELDPSSPLHATADLYPPFGHLELDAALGSSGGRYLCTHDYDAPLVQIGNPGSLPEGATPLRDALLFPEGPLTWSEPRPDSVDNPFCATCHSPDHYPTLTPDVLAADVRTPAVIDPRRQPNQPPPLLFGNLPADLLGPGLPDADLVAPLEGVLVDPWLLPE